MSMLAIHRKPAGEGKESCGVEVGEEQRDGMVAGLAVQRYLHLKEVVRDLV